MELTLKVPFENEKTAEIAWNSLRVDPEPKRSGLVKELSVQGNVLQVHFKCQEARILRVSVNTFFDLLNLVVQTMDQFDIE
jgi:EKC/KEOPS complex subunit PCC1/LAGE3